MSYEKGLEHWDGVGYGQESPFWWKRGTVEVLRVFPCM
jgi:hypothetical protein